MSNRGRVASPALVFAIGLALSACGRPGSPAPSPTPGASASSPAIATRVPTATASASSSDTPTPEPSPSASVAAAVEPGCFDLTASTGTTAPMPSMVPAEELRNRLPILSPAFSQRMAFIGSSLTDGGIASIYVSAFQACSGAGRASIRFGWVKGGEEAGVVPMAVEINGYTGWQLAAMMIDGNAQDPTLRSRLTFGAHHGWEYLYTDSLALSASSTTLYLMQAFCCVDATRTDTFSFEQVVNDYLDRTNDTPAPMSAAWHQ